MSRAPQQLDLFIDLLVESVVHEWEAGELVTDSAKEVETIAQIADAMTEEATKTSQAVAARCGYQSHNL